ncbi:MAG: fibro-slime domain-containing protein [Oscillospiraceae bacterium]|nr:fibro-slime domain-containing protein [Oscillospiraceae bacterium]
MESMRKEARKYLAKQRRTQRWQKVVTTLAGVVVFCTTYALILPAITMTTPLVCEKEEHTHTEACYAVETVTHTRQLVCEEPEAEPHTHDESCYTQETTYACVLEETEGHIHSGDCYTMMKGELTCTTEFDTVEREVTEEVARQVEHETTDEEGNPVTALETVTEEVTRTVTEEVPHVHTDDCYAWTEELTCGLEETEGHTHTEACGAETVEALSCGKEETEGHTHTDDCYLIPENEGETEEGKTLICEQEEHVHDDNCYLALELEEKVKYYCGFDAEHTHAEDCFFEDGALKCTISEHTHTEECLAEPLPEPEPVELCETFTAESEDGAVILTLHVSGTVLLPQAEAAEGEEIQESGFELVLTESKDLDAYDAYIELASEEGEVVAMGVLDYTLTYNGEPVDLSDCEMTAEVVPTEAFQQYMEDPQALGLMTLDVVDEDETSDEETETLETLFTAYTEREGTVAYALTRGANPEFTVEYYAYLERAVKTDYGLTLTDMNTYKAFIGQGKLPVINTEGGKLPENGKGRFESPNSNNIAYLIVDSEGRIVTQRQLTEIYQSERLTYQKAPGLKYFNIVLKNKDSQYKLTQIWVLNAGGDTESEETNRYDEEIKKDWTAYDYSDTIRFTNRPETAAADPDNFILIETDAVIRLVYDTKEVIENLPANFYDYNITDGTKTTDANGIIHVKTQMQGINSNANYAGKTGRKLAFGNGSVGMGREEEIWKENVLNKANTRSFSISVFGLAPRAEKVITSEGKTEYRIRYDEDLAVPNLFNEGAAVGKTTYSAKEGEMYSLNFERVGDTYTLSSVEGTQAANLTQFNHPQFGANAPYTHILTNNFWPLDNVEDPNADVLFGSVANQKKIWFGDNEWKSLPNNDDGQDHNAFFGMQFAVTFDLTKNYVGPLEYYFFGDDDMWVFLDEQLVCDIGGVHSAVGEYVNLWDYINKADLEALAEDETKTYTLTFYYTERGAGGSTCWMQFTLPTVVGLDLESELEKEVNAENGSLWIEKQLTGVENTDWFDFKLELDGVNTYDNFVIQNANGEVITQGDGVKEYISGNDDTFRLRGGDVLVIQKLPKGTKYTITEVNNQGYHTESATFLSSAEKEAEKNNTELQKTVVQGSVASGDIEVNDITKVIFTNTASYELPATGGSGTTLWYTMGTLLLAGAAYLMYKKRQWIMREGDAM